MDRVTTTKRLLGDIAEKSPSGFAIALHVRFTTPAYLFQSYNKDWMEHYSSKGLVMQDPTVRWGLENNGTVKWSDLTHLDSAGVLQDARSFGLEFGVTVAISDAESKTISSFSRSDRDFEASEVDALVKAVTEMHAETLPRDDDAEFEEAMKRLSIELTHS